MTDSLTETELDDHADDGDDHADHPSDVFYVKIALVLAFFTLIEVGTYFESVHKAPDWALYFILTFLMVVKFAMVGAYFMHLKYDTPWFRYVFITGLALATLVYGVFFFTFDLFGLG